MNDRTPSHDAFRAVLDASERLPDAPTTPRPKAEPTSVHLQDARFTNGEIEVLVRRGGRTVPRG